MPQPAFIASTIVGSTRHIEINLHQGDVQRIRARLQGTKGRIDAGLWARAKAMADIGVNMLDMAAPRGEDGNWQRGEPPLSESHRAQLSTPYYLSLIHISEPTRLLSISYAVFCLK